MAEDLALAPPDGRKSGLHARRLIIYFAVRNPSIHGAKGQPVPSGRNDCLGFVGGLGFDFSGLIAARFYARRTFSNFSFLDR